MNKQAKEVGTSLHKDHPVDHLAGMLNSSLRRVDREILDRLESPVSLIPELAQHLVTAGGKRIRPLVSLAFSHLSDCEEDKAVKFATALELIHSATLLHDDVIDESSLRRGRQTAHHVWGNTASILVGDFLLARTFSLMVEAGDLKVLELLARTSETISEGEVLQLMSSQNLELALQHYPAIIEGKTAALFAAATEVGPLAARKGQDLCDAARIYGRELGLAFQLADDALDYGGSAGLMGKAAGDDFRDGKPTLPLLMAWEAGNAEEKAFWEQVLAAKIRTEEDFQKACHLIESHKTLSLTLEKANKHSQKAQQALLAFPSSPLQDGLHELAAFVVQRHY